MRRPAIDLVGQVEIVLERHFQCHRDAAEALGKLGAPILVQILALLYSRSNLSDVLPPSANITVSNVPGPPVPLYLAGAKLRHYHPVSIVTHGLAFNIAMDLEPFRRINPCGYAGLQVTSMADLGGPSSLETVQARLLEPLAVQFSLHLSPAAPEPFA